MNWTDDILSLEHGGNKMLNQADGDKCIDPMCVCVCVCVCVCARALVTQPCQAPCNPMDSSVAHQASLPMEFPRQEY